MQFNDDKSANFLTETDKSFRHLILQNVKSKGQDRDVLSRLFRCFLKFASEALSLTIDCDLKAFEYLIILSIAVKIEKLVIRNGTSNETTNCQSLLGLNQHIMERLKLQVLKVERCNEAVAEMLLMLRINSIVELDLEEFPIAKLRQFVAVQSSILGLRLSYLAIDKNELKVLEKVGQNLRLTKLSLHFDFVNRENPKIDLTFAEIVSFQSSLQHLELRVPNAGKKIFDAIKKLQLKSLVMEVPGKALDDVRLLFKSTILEKLTLYGPRSSCVSICKLRDERAKPSLVKFEYKFVD